MCLTPWVSQANKVHETSIRIKEFLFLASQKPPLALPSHFPLASITTTLSPTTMLWNSIQYAVSYVCLLFFRATLVGSIHTLPIYESFRAPSSLQTPVLSVLHFSHSGGCREAFHCSVNLPLPVVLTCLSLVSNEVEPPCTYILTIWTFSL